jgi:hypothetical protein
VVFSDSKICGGILDVVCYVGLGIRGDYSNDSQLSRNGRDILKIGALVLG